MRNASKRTLPGFPRERRKEPGLRRAEVAVADDDAAYGGHFRPHLVWVTSNRIPQPIFVAALCGGYEKMHHYFRDGSAPSTFVDQALALVPDHAGIPGFGWIRGFFINYGPDEAVRYDLDGHPLERSPVAHRIGRPIFRA